MKIVNFNFLFYKYKSWLHTWNFVGQNHIRYACNCFPQMYCLITSEAAIPPWVGYNEEETMKNQILALSTVSRQILYFVG